MKTISFTKMTAAGNDFILVDNRKGLFPKNAANLAARVAARLCDRRFSVGGDGLILLGKSRDAAADFTMTIYNPDGSRPSMCGNGARCLALFAYLNKAAGKTMAFTTGAGLIRADILPRSVRVQMTEPHGLRLDYTVKTPDGDITLSSLDTGVPHAVVFVNDIGGTNVPQTGRMLRNHAAFSPRGTNVDFVKPLRGNTIAVRTYERGVEDETLACGTGCTASAIIAGIKGLASSPVTCVTRSGVRFKVSFRLSGKDARISGVFLEGPAEVCFTGKVTI